MTTITTNNTSRSCPEWFGKHPDAAIPNRVKIRVFEKQGGKCAITGKRLQAGQWDIDHITPLKDGGEHRESNLQAVSREAHRAKTAKENHARAKVNRVQSKHVLPKKQGSIQSKPFASRLKSDDKAVRIAASHKAHRERMNNKFAARPT